MNPYQPQTGQYTPYVQAYPGYEYVPVATPPPATFYAQYQGYQQQPYAAYQTVPPPFPATQNPLGTQGTYPQVGYYVQPNAVVPSTISVTTGTTTGVLPQVAQQTFAFAGAAVPPVSTTQAQPTVVSTQVKEEQQKYVEQYEQWQKQYKDWLEQNQNHPDQKQFQQWQQQMQSWQQQCSQVIPTQKTDDPKLEPPNKQQKLTQPQEQQQQQPSQSVFPNSQTTNPSQTLIGPVLPSSYTQPPPQIGQQSLQFGQQLQPVGNQAQSMTQPTSNIGHPPQNVAPQNQSIGYQGQNLGNQNTRQQNQNIGHSAQNMGFQAQSMGNQRPNLGPQAQNMGHKPQNMGPPAQIMGHQPPNMGHQPPNMGQQNQSIGQKPQNLGPPTQSTVHQNQNMEHESQHFRPLAQGMGRQPHNMGQQNQSIGQKPQHFGPPVQNTGRQSQNMGPPDQNLGRQPQNMGQQNQNMGQKPQDMGWQNQNMGHKSQDMGWQNQNMGPKAQDMGKQNQKMGHQIPNNDYQTPNKGYQTPKMGNQTQQFGQQTQNSGQQNRQTGYNRSPAQGGSSSSQFSGPKPLLSQGYNQSGNDGYGPGGNKQQGDQSSSYPPRQSYAGAKQTNFSHEQEDYNETDEDYHEYGSEDAVDETDSESYNYNSPNQPPYSQYPTRPPRPQFHQQNRFPRPRGGVQPTRSPRPYGQFRHQSPNQNEGFRPRGAQQSFSPRGPRHRMPGPRGNRPPFPDEYTGFRSPRPPRYQPPASRPQFEHSPRQPSPRQPSPRMRLPNRPLLGQNNQRPPRQNFNMRGPRPQEPRFRVQTPYKEKDHGKTQQPVKSAAQPSVNLVRPLLTQSPRKPFTPTTQPSTQVSTPQSSKPLAPPTSQTAGQSFVKPTNQTFVKPPTTQPLAKPQAQPPQAQSVAKPPIQPLSKPKQSLNKPSTEPFVKPSTPTLPKSTVQPSKPLTLPLAKPQAQSSAKPSVQPSKPLTLPLSKPQTQSSAKPPVQPPKSLTLPLSKPQAQLSAKPSVQPPAQPFAKPQAQTPPSSLTNKIQTILPGEENVSKKSIDVQSNEKGSEDKEKKGDNVTVKDDHVIKEKQAEKAEGPPQEKDGIKQNTTSTGTPSKDKPETVPDKDRDSSTSVEIEILKRQQDQLNKLKELEILQRNKTKQEDKDDRAVKENNKEIKEGKQTDVKIDEGVPPEKSYMLCKKFPDCGLAEDCYFRHPLCKFDNRCKKPECSYWHTVPLDQRHSGRKLLAIQEGRYYDEGQDDRSEYPRDYDDRDGLREIDFRDSSRVDYDRERVPPEDPYYRERQEFPRGPSDDYREHYEDRGYPQRERDEYERQPYDDYEMRDNFDRRLPPPRIERELEQDLDWREERLLPPRDFERHPDELEPYRDRFGDRGPGLYERDPVYRDTDREYYDRLQERDLLERDYDRRLENDPIHFERDREWRGRGFDRRRDPYDDPYHRDPMYESRERRPPFDFPERYPEEFDRRRERDLYDERLDIRRPPRDRDFRHPDDDLPRGRYLDERESFQRREAFDYNHGGNSDAELDNRDTRKSRDTPVKPKPKPKVTPIGTLLDTPGRETRPERIVFIFRGVPGSGKTHIARLIKDKELACGAPTPRILSLDDYFLQETTTHELDPETGKKVEVKGTEYEYEAELEESYRNSLFKAFNKTLDDGFFPMVILDCINNKVEHFERFWSQAKQKGFEVYVAEITADANDCAKRNTHHRTLEEINKMLEKWEETPRHHTRLDVRSLLQDAAITEVEMEAVEAPEESKDVEGEPSEEKEDEEAAEGEEDHLGKSRWDDVDVTESQLDKLDGIRLRGNKRKAHGESPTDDVVDDDPYDEREEDMRLGKKRVRWADIEERKHLEHRRRIGFCIGTDWSLFTNPDAEIPK